MRLLVSVSDRAEVDAALRGGAEIIDVKDPSVGPLGAPDPAVAASIRTAVSPPHLMSIAIGDASGDVGPILERAHALAAVRPDFIKIGLRDAGPAAKRALVLVAAALADLDPAVRLVGVGYADRLRDESLSLPELARNAGAHAIMLDTFRKDGTPLPNHVQEDGIREFVARAHGFGLMAGLAGSLGRVEIVRLADSGADVIGVRGAACRGGRRGRVSAARVRDLAQSIRRQPPASGTMTSTSSPADAVGK